MEARPGQQGAMRRSITRWVEANAMTLEDRSNRESAGAFRDGERGAAQLNARSCPLQPKRGREKIDWHSRIAIRWITRASS